jgi:hypothetical protein
MNVPPIEKVMKLVKSFQVMLLKHNEAHMALIQTLGKRRSMLIPKSKTKLMKAHYLNPFTRKKLKVQCVCRWLVQVEAFMETQGYTLDVEWFCSTQMLLKDHVLDWWMVQK